MVEIQIPLTGKEPPPGWKLVETKMDGSKWMNSKRKMSVIMSVTREFDGKLWAHMSIAHMRRMPTYEDLVYLKRHWAGDDKKCIMVMPSSSEHVNIHPNCLHLFCCLDDDPLPDFTHGSGSI